MLKMIFYYTSFSQAANRWGLVRVNPAEELPYICEIKKEDLHHAVLAERNIGTFLLLNCTESYCIFNYKSIFFIY